MFSYKRVIFFILLGVLTQLEASCYEFDKNHYYNQGLSKNDSICYSYHIYSQKIPVFTLKQDGYSDADFDIFIYDYSDLSGRLGSGIKSGSKSELVTLSYQNSSNYVYVKIKNVGSGYGKFNLYIHEIDISQKIADTLAQSTIQAGVELILEGLFDVNENSNTSAKRNISRGSTAIMSYLNNQNLSDTSKNLMINELTTKIQEEFGYGFTGKLLVNFAVSIIRDMYRYY